MRRNVVFGVKRNPGLGDIFIEAAAQFNGISIKPASAKDLLEVKNLCAVITVAFESIVGGSVGIAVPVKVKENIELKTGKGSDYSDVLKEIANILCGLFVKKIFGDRIQYKMRVPEMFTIDAGVWKVLVKDIEEGFFIEGEPAMVFSTIAQKNI